MNSGELYHYYKEQYEREIARRVELRSALVLPFGVITLIGGALLAAVRELSRPFGIFEWGILVCFAVTVIFMMCSIYNLWRSYYNYGYLYLPTAKQIMDWHAELENYYKNITVPAGTGDADKQVIAFLKERYANAAHENTIINDQKSALIHRANTFLMYSLISGAVFGLGFLVYSLFGPK